MIIYKKAVLVLSEGNKPSRRTFKGKNLSMYKNSDGLFEICNRVSETETEVLIIFPPHTFYSLVYSK